MRKYLNLLIAFSFLLFSSNLFSQYSLTWTGAANNNDWEDPNNWMGTPPSLGYPDQSTVVIFNSYDLSADITINEASIEVRSFRVNSGALTNYTLTLEVGNFSCYGDFYLNDHIIIRGENANTNAIINLKGPSNISSLLSIPGQDQHNMELVIQSDAKYYIDVDLIQQKSVIEMYGGDFYTYNPYNSQSPSFDIDINKIVIHGGAHTQSFWTDTSTLTLRSNEDPLAGIQHLENYDFDSTKIILKDMDDNIPPDFPVPTQGTFDMAHKAFGDLIIDRPMTLENCGAVNDLTITSSYTYFIEDTLTINGSLTQTWLGGTPDCSKFTLLMAANPGESAFIYPMNSCGLEYVYVRNIVKLGITAQFSLDNYIKEGSSGFAFQTEESPRILRWSANGTFWSCDGMKSQWHCIDNWEEYDSTSQSWSAATCFPKPIDDVIFDNNSFSSNHNVVHILPRTIAFCKNMRWDNVTNMPEFKISGNLIVTGDFIMDEPMNFGFIDSSNPLYQYMKDIPCVYFASRNQASINPKRKKMFVDVRFIGEGNSEYMIQSKFDVRDLTISSGLLIAQRKMIIADRLIIDDSPAPKGFIADSSVLIIDSSTILTNQKYEYASFDVMSDSANVSCNDTRIVLKGENAVFNGARNNYHVVDFKNNGHLVSSNSFNRIIINNGKHFSIGAGDSVIVKESFEVTDTLGADTTRIFVNEIRRVGESFSPAFDHGKLKLEMSDDLCLQTTKISDIEVSTEPGFEALCDFSYVNFSPSNSYLTPPAGWTDRSDTIPCYSFIEGFVMNDSSNQYINQGLVSCFRVYMDTGQTQYMYDTIGMTWLDSNGRFLFTNLDTGRYILKADPFDMALIPHYWPNKKMWHNAGKLNLQHNVHNVKIGVTPLMPLSNAPSANKIIKGWITPTLGGNAPQPLFNMTQAHLRGPVDIEDSLVIGLYNLDPNNFGVVQTVLSDTSGFFMFTNVDVGNYRVHPDIAGIPVDTLHSLATISVDSTTDSASIVFEVADSMIWPASSVIVSTDLQPEVELIIWPNPVNDALNIRAPYNIETIEIYDLMLRRFVMPFTRNGSDVRINMHKLSSGMYMLYVNGERLRYRIVKP